MNDLWPKGIWRHLTYFCHSFVTFILKLKKKQFDLWASVSNNFSLFAKIITFERVDYLKQYITECIYKVILKYSIALKISNSCIYLPLLLFPCFIVYGIWLKLQLIRKSSTTPVQRYVYSATKISMNTTWVHNPNVEQLRVLLLYVFDSLF